jgi:hypothetical protein
MSDNEYDELDITTELNDIQELLKDDTIKSSILVDRTVNVVEKLLDHNDKLIEEYNEKKNREFINGFFIGLLTGSIIAGLVIKVYKR